MKVLLLALALASAALVSGCGGISLGELDQFAINYKVTVTNGANQPAAVIVDMADTHRAATLAPGESVEIVSFKPGPWRVAIAGSEGRRELLKSEIAKLTAQLDGMTNKNSRSYDELDDDLDDMEDALEKVGDHIPSGSCAGRMEDRAGEELVVRVGAEFTSKDLTWNCT